MEFIGQCVTFLIIWKDKKKFCASARFWDLGPGFLAFRRPSAFFRPKKSQKQASGQNDLAAAQFFFVLHDDIVVHFSMKHFYVYLKMLAFKCCTKSGQRMLSFFKLFGGIRYGLLHQNIRMEILCHEQ